MKALVTGATGFVGSWVADLLREKGFEVRCTVRKTSSLRWVENKGYELVQASLYDKESLKKAVEDVDYIFHIAGLTFARNFEAFMKGNRDAVKNLLEATEEVNPNVKRFLLMSSLAAVGPSKSLGEPVSEETPMNPITSYGKSKKAGEDVAKEYSEKFPITIVRAPAVYGPRDSAIFPIFKAAKMGIGTLIGKSPKYISLVHSSDLARGIVDATLSEKAANETYFISSESFHTWDQLIKSMAEFFGKKKVIKIKIPHSIVLGAGAVTQFVGKFLPKPPIFNYEKGVDFIQDYWTCSIEKAKRELDYSEEMKIDEGVENTIQWYKENNWL